MIVSFAFLAYSLQTIDNNCHCQHIRLFCFSPEISFGRQSVERGKVRKEKHRWKKYRMKKYQKKKILKEGDAMVN